MGQDSDSVERQSDGKIVGRQPLTIHWLSRVLLAALGLALLAVSARGALSTDNELGAVSLSLVGALFFTVGAMGRWPSKLVWGDKSAEWLEEVLEASVAKGSPQTQRTILETAEQAATSPQQLSVARNLRRWMTYVDREDIEKLGVLVPEGAILSVNGPAAAVGSIAYEATIYPTNDADEKKAVAVILPGQSVYGAGTSARMQHLLDKGYGAVLIAYRGLEAGTYLEMIADAAPSGVFTVDLASRPADITATISRALSHARQHAVERE